MKKQILNPFLPLDKYIPDGEPLIPISDSEQKFKTVIYAHGAESNYKSNITTLKSLAKSGIACYTFDFYGWTSKST